MSKIDSKLSAERLRELLSYDPETGVFTCLVYRGPKAQVGMTCGSLNDGYIRISIGAKLYPAHRLAWLYMIGEWPKDKIDHRDTDRANNRWINLREATHSANMQNQRVAHKGNKSGYLGVSPSRDRFRAFLQIDGQMLRLGTYDTAELAHSAYLAAKRVHHPASTL